MKIMHMLMLTIATALLCGMGESRIGETAEEGRGRRELWDWSCWWFCSNEPEGINSNIRPADRPEVVCRWVSCPDNYSWRSTTGHSCNWWTQCTDDFGFINEDCMAAPRVCQHELSCQDTADPNMGRTCQL